MISETKPDSTLTDDQLFRELLSQRGVILGVLITHYANVQRQLDALFFDRRLGWAVRNGHLSGAGRDTESSVGGIG